MINLQTGWNCHFILSGKFPNSIIFQGGFTARKSLVDLSAVSTCVTIGMSICAAWQNSSGIFASVHGASCIAPEVPIWCCASVFHKCIYRICRTHSEYKRNHKADDVTMFDPSAKHGFTATNLLRHSLQGTKYCKPGKRAWKFDTSQNSIFRKGSGILVIKFSPFQEKSWGSWLAFKKQTGLPKGLKTPSKASEYQPSLIAYYHNVIYNASFT